MRKIGDALRLKAAGLTTRKIAASLGIGQTTANEYLKRAERAGLSWPLPEGWSEADLEQRLFPSAAEATRPRRGRRSPIRTSAGPGTSTEEENDARPPDTRPAP